MNFAAGLERAFRYFLPSPFAIALLLSLVCFILVGLTGEGSFIHNTNSALKSWNDGLYQSGLLVFMVQMMLILVLGHALALAEPVQKLIDRILSLSQKPAQIAALVCLSTLVVAFFNWGLGLVFGAIMARRAGEKLSSANTPFNYGVLGAAGYSGLMVWHGGISGSAPIKVAESQHLSELMQGSAPELMAALPERIGFTETVFSAMNLSASLALLIVLPGSIYFLAKLAPAKQHLLQAKIKKSKSTKVSGAERLDQSAWFAWVFSALIFWMLFRQIQAATALSFLTPNFINLLLLALGLAIHQGLGPYSRAVEEASKGAAGILLQFPIYFGIMGLMKSSGLLNDLSLYFSSIASNTSLPIYTLFSASVVNLFIPSGGGQWAIQGPVTLSAAQNLQVPFSKVIMALAYGDQLSNMLQPFWALPLLGITGLNAKEIVPHSFILMLVGIFIFVVTLLVF